RQETFVDGIELVAVLGIFLLLHERRRRVRDLVAFDDAMACWNAEARAVILNVQGRGVEHLPDALAVWRPFAGLGRCIGGLRRDWIGREHAAREGKDRRG